MPATRAGAPAPAAHLSSAGFDNKQRAIMYITHTRGPGCLIRRYAHNCSSFTGWLFIDETCEEFLRCRCFDATPELLKLQDALAVRMDRKRSA